MPELAEVEFYRKEWNPGLGHKVLRVHANTGARVFRDCAAPDKLAPALTGKTYRASFAHGKNLLFAFSGNLWLGGHLGMSGKLTAKAPDYVPEKHDHLVLVFRDTALVFTDYRMFGRLVLDRCKREPEWWQALPPAILSARFTLGRMESHLARRSRSPLKAALLDQAIFPGVGNWMADEILWRCGHYPGALCATLTKPEARELWKVTRRISRDAVRIIGTDWSDPPDSWLFNHRWKKGQACPRCATPLARDEIAGRTTCWCPKCQGQH
jgi:formamidopyrimidine-DNA glycosylase